METGNFEGLTIEEIYSLFTTPDNGYPNWPDEKIQAGYTGSNKLATLRQALSYVKLMEEDGAFVENWRGLDYACGWGRFASVLLKHGTPEQLDVADAWPRSLEFIRSLGFNNKIIEVSTELKDGELKSNEYDFILSFSLFTHLNQDPFRNNLEKLSRSLKQSGRFYFTVRHDNFLDHKYSDMADQHRKELAENGGFWFRDSGGDQLKAGQFGDAVVNSEFMTNVIPENTSIRHVGAPTLLQQMYCVERA